MATKPGDGNNSSKKNITKKVAGKKKPAAKAKKQVEEEGIEFDDDEQATKVNKKPGSVESSIDEDEDDSDFLEEENDNVKDGEEGEDWDPDFNEFDLPKSSKKTPLGKKPVKDDDDDFKIDDEFRDLFGSKSSSRRYNEDDDF